MNYANDLIRFIFEFNFIKGENMKTTSLLLLLGLFPQIAGASNVYTGEYCSGTTMIEYKTICREIPRSGDIRCKTIVVGEIPNHPDCDNATESIENSSLMIFHMETSAFAGCQNGGDRICCDPGTNHCHCCGGGRLTEGYD